MERGARAAIVAVSGQTRDDLVKWYGVDPEDVTIIPPARDPAFAQAVPGDRRCGGARAARASREYLLSVGTLERRKNHRVLVEALALLDPRTHRSLVLVGRDGGEAKALRIAGRRARRGGAGRIHHGVASRDLPGAVPGRGALPLSQPVRGVRDADRGGAERRRTR